MTVLKFLALTAVATATIVFANPLYAQSKAEIINQCLNGDSAITENERKELARQVADWPTVFSPILGENGVRCLTEQLGGEWRYSPVLKKFVGGTDLSKEEIRLNVIFDRQQEARKTLDELNALPEKEGYALQTKARRCELLEEIAQNQASIEAAERARSEMRAQVRISTVRECEAWYLEDSRSAITNAVCNGVFSEFGIPQPEEQYPLAEINAKQELEKAELFLNLLDTYNLLPEDGLKYFVAKQTLSVEFSECD